MRVIKWAWLLGIMSFWREKNLCFEGVTGTMGLGFVWEVIGGQWDAVIKNLAKLGEGGETAHFFLTVVWINKDGVLVRLVSFGRGQNLRESQQIEERGCPKMIFACINRALTRIARIVTNFQTS